MDGGRGIGPVDREWTAHWHASERRRAWHNAQHNTRRADSHVVHVQRDPKDALKQQRAYPHWRPYNRNAHMHPIHMFVHAPTCVSWRPRVLQLLLSEAECVSDAHGLIEAGAHN